ncbi:MAG: hypothetical protein OXC91_14255 [Rhodobacteraceae bacterium]|nr:hypothetical protein [Paracoccaceae bacterium]
MKGGDGIESKAFAQIISGVRMALPSSPPDTPSRHAPWAADLGRHNATKTDFESNMMVFFLAICPSPYQNPAAII